MKKKIRSEIAKLANQIISAEGTFNTIIMKEMVGHLHEKLSVLHYLESQLGESQNMNEGQSLDSKSFREEHWFTEPEPLPQSQHKEALVEPLMEKIKDIVAQMPEESQQIDEMLDEVLPKTKYVKNDLEEFASSYRQTPTFERKEPSKGLDVIDEKVSDSFPLGNNIKTHSDPSDNEQNRAKSINDKLNKGLNIGLNDRLAFIRHLFNDNDEDYARVLAQISSMKSYDEAATFIKGKIKPTYNYWLKKDRYSERFMSIIEKSFN